MFIKSAAKVILVTAALTGSSIANAISFNFEAIADNEPGGNTYGVATGEYGSPSMTFSQGGINVTATGYNTNTPSTEYNAYLDSGDAGLGVCKTLTRDSQCNPGSDDNVTFGESLKLVFDQKVEITTTTFVNGSHGTSFNGLFDLSIDGTSTTETLVHSFAGPLIGTTFIFSNINTASKLISNDLREFYINTLDVKLASAPSSVPIPAAAWLFGTGFMGLLSMAKRRKVENQVAT
ncbi:MAG: hypothetical protein methR_P0859 [Methyloprofundus sp.]|nr:MAG: hypothetical protein methR_P0859 [Methyloprofundus sp.]